MEFTDEIEKKVGGVAIKIRRLTIGQIREARGLFEGGGVNVDEHYDKLIRDHVRLADGSAIDPAALSMPQMREIVSDLVGIPEGSGISDFIGLLC